MGVGPDARFFHPKMGLCQIFFKVLLAGLTNPRDISDSFAVTPLAEGDILPVYSMYQVFFTHFMDLLPLALKIHKIDTLPLEAEIEFTVRPFPRI